MKEFVFDLQRFVTFLNGTDSSEYLEVTEAETVVYAKGGHDTVYSSSHDNVTMSGGAGNDYIENFLYGDKISMAGGTGNDTIYDWGDYNIIVGGAGNDFIRPGNFTTVTGGKGNDTIYAYGSHSSVIKYSSGDGNDVVEGFNSGDTLYIAKGNYTTMLSGYSDFVVKVGKQTITLMHAVLDEYNKVIIKDSSGNIAVYNDWKVMKGTSGNDDLINEANNVTVNGGAGNDDIYNYGSYVTILGGDGKDYIDSRGYNCVIDGGKGNDTIYSYSEGNLNISISGAKGNDDITSYGSYVTILGGTGSDSIQNNHGDNSNISGGDGNDYIDSSGENCVIDGGKDNDTILAYFADNSTITGDKGNDTIYACLADNPTITGGKGNDSIGMAFDKNVVIKYASGDGKDTIIGFDSNDILHITKGSYSVSTKGDDVIVKVGKGSITLKDAVGTSISIKDSKGNVTTKTYGSSALFAEDNFATADNLSTIVENNLGAVSEVETQNFDTLTQKNNLITFADK